MKIFSIFVAYLENTNFLQIAISGPKAKSGQNVTSGRKAIMMHFEEVLSGDDLLAL